MWLAAVALALTVVWPSPAFAQCGGLNEPACSTSTCSLRGAFGNCLLWRTTRTCDTNRLNVQLTLQGYRCVACGGSGQPRCDAGAACSSGTVLGPLGQTCLACGGAGQPACGGGTCGAGTRNILGLCTACGGPGQPVCTSGSACESRANPTGIGESAVCVACGGSFDRPCQNSLPACDSGLNLVGSPIDGRCLPVDCGGAGQLQCGSGPACQPRHQPVLDLDTGFGLCVACGGPGQPFCETLDPGCDRPLHDAAGICTELAPDISEPDCNCTAVPSPAPAGSEVWGFADLHAHQFANLGFGGVQFVGAPFDPDGIAFALPGCGFTVDFPTVRPSGAPIEPGDLEGVPVHGALHVRDLFGLAAGNPLGLSNYGSTGPVIPASFSFNGWPLWRSPDHQRMYYRWLERAYRGGLRLMIAQAVNNEVSCLTADQRVDTDSGARQPFGCNDMATVERQIQAAKDLERFIDDESGGPGLGWYRIVASAAEAREVIAAGKMAVVLGIEVDTLFDCRGGLCTEATVESQLQRYYDLGVRHAYPVHLFDNDFGGAAYYWEAFNAGNRVVNGAFFDTYDCSADGFEFQGARTTIRDAVTEFITRFFGLPSVPVTVNGADCNTKGLSPLGRFLVGRMMDMGMIIDADHLSYNGVNDVLAMAESREYPIVATHVYPADLHSGTDKGERKWTAGQLRRLRDLGGIASPILIPESTNEYLRNGAPVVANDCPSSSKEWAQRYLRTVELMSGGPYPAGVGYGSDFNGMTKGLAPRFGDDACGSDALAVQAQPVQYPFSAAGGVFNRAVTGGRTFDYNTDGVAHVGLIPDFIQDLRNVGLTDQDLEPFFRSAEAFVQMWERIDARGTAPPTTAVTVVPPPNAAGWNATPVTLTLSAWSQPGGAAVSRITYQSSGAETFGPIDVAGAAATIDIAAAGSTALSFYAADAAGRQENARSIAVQIDPVPPDVTPIVSPAPNAAGWHMGDVTVAFQGTDDGSGVAACDEPVVLTGEGTDLAAAGACRDVAGNTSPATEATGINIDRTAPRIDLNLPQSPVYRLHQEPPASYSCVDDGSGVTECAGTVPTGAAVPTDTIGSHAFAVTARDAAGNESSASVQYSVVYDFSGFLGAISGPPTINEVDAGRAVAVKFGLGGDQGMTIFAAGYPTSQQIACDATLMTEAIDETIAAQWSYLTFKAETARYQYAWKTHEAWAGTCRQLNIRLADGTDHPVVFRFR